MPVITIEGPHISDLAVKRKFVAELTDSAARAFGMPREAMIVLLRESSPDNVSVGGCLVCDRENKVL